MSKRDYNALANKPLNSLQPLELLQLACSTFSSDRVKRACWKLLGVRHG